MAETEKSKPLQVNDWSGRVSNASPHKIPPGAMVVQDNIQCLEPGVLTVRKGVVKSSDYTAATPSAYTIISLFGYNVPDTDWMVAADTNGTVTTRRSSGTTTTVVSGKSGYWPWSFEKSRHGDLIGINGMDRGFIWNGLSGGTARELGIDPPSAAPTILHPVGGAATAGDYTCAYRYVDDSVPTERYSSISSSTTVTVETNDQFQWSGLLQSSQSRVVLIELWRSASEASNTLYRIARLGHNGTVTDTANNGGSVQYTTSSAHNLAEGAVVTTSGTDQDVTTTAVKSVDSATTFTVDAASSTTGSTDGTWVLTGFNQDANGDGGDVLGDTALIAAAAADLDLKLTVLTPTTKAPNARKHGVPPKWKSVVKSFQDRAWYGVDVTYGEGTVTTNGTTTIVGSGTAWTTDMDGRYLYIDGESGPLVISSAPSATGIVTTEAASTSAAGKSYAIRPNPTERFKWYYSEVDLFESVPTVNTVTLQENTDDDDDDTGGFPFGSVFYITRARHIYSLTYARQPNIDANPRLIAHRGMVGPHAYAIHEGTAYILDEMGAYAMTMDGGVTPISGPLQDVFRGSTLDFTTRRWWHVAVDPRYELVYFFVAMTGDTYPKDALVYHIRTNQWWTESYFDYHADSAMGLASGAVVVYLAGEKDAVFQLNGGATDYVSSQTRATADSGTENTIEDADGGFDSTLVGAPVGIESGTGKNQLRKVSAATSTTLTVSTNWTTNPDSTSVYRIGAIQWNFKTGRMPLIDADEHNQRSVTLTFEPTSGVNQFDVRRYYNHETTPENYPISRSATSEAGLMTETQDDPDAVAPMQIARTTESNHPGWCSTRFDGRIGEGQSVRWLQIECRGFKGDDDLQFYAMELVGVG